MSQQDAELSVLLLSPTFQARGSCAYTLRLAKALPERGISVRVVTPDARLLGAALSKSLHVHEYRHLDHWLLQNIVQRWVVRDVAADVPDLVHIQSRRMQSVGVAIAKRLSRPYLLTIHQFLGPTESLSVNPAYCAGVVAVSDAIRANLIARTRIPRHLISVIESGVEIGVPSERPAPLAPGRVPVVGTAGPLESVRGVPFFLGAAARVLASGRDVEFVVAGAGPEEPHLRRLAAELGIAQRVTFVPYGLDFRESLAAMDLFCLPSLQQGLGTIMLEAMSLGLPVIASGVGGVYSVVRDGETGVIVPPSRSIELAENIQRLLADPVLARQMGTTAQRLVETEFSVSRMVDRTVALYRQIPKAKESATASLA